MKIARQVGAPLKQLPPAGAFLQLGAKIGVGDGDQGLGPLSQVLSVKAGHSELSHHIVNVSPCRHHT